MKKQTIENLNARAYEASRDLRSIVGSLDIFEPEEAKVDLAIAGARVCLRNLLAIKRMLVKSRVLDSEKGAR